MYRVTIEDGLNKNSRSHLSLADAPIFTAAEAVMALPEVATAYTTDLKKLTFDKSRMTPIGKAVEALKNLHEILVRFEAYRTQKQNEEQILKVDQVRFARKASEIDRVFMAYISGKGHQFESKQLLLCRIYKYKRISRIKPRLCQWL